MPAAVPSSNPKPDHYRLKAFRQVTDFNSLWGGGDNLLLELAEARKSGRLTQRPVGIENGFAAADAVPAFDAAQIGPVEVSAS